MRLRVLISVLALCVIVIHLPAEGAIPESQRAALIALYESTSGDGWTTNTGWRNLTGDGFQDAGTECSWYGVTCSAAGDDITEIDLMKNNLVGPIPPEIGDLPELRRLALSFNQVNGHLPLELSSLEKLQVFLLEMNNVGGEIPPSMGELTSLLELGLGDNEFEGEVPPELGLLSRLQVLNLTGNMLEGEIPPEFGNLHELKWLLVAENQLRGTFPPELAQLSKLEMLFCLDNQFSGLIPNWIGNLTRLKLLDLSLNRFTGEIPPEIGNCQSLQFLTMWDNLLTGPIPSEIGALHQLRVLHLQNNALTGPLPPELGDLQSLENLTLSINQISGRIPAELGNLPALQTISLTGNQLGGGIPAELSRISTLRTLSLARNRLVGSIPSEIGSLSALKSLFLMGNQLNGPIPLEITQLTELTAIDLHFNALHSDDPDVRSFLDSNHWGPWEDTQTRSPDSVRGSAVDGSTIDLSWDEMTVDDSIAAGHYTAFFATSEDGPFIPFSDTASKDDLAISVTGLIPGTDYWLVVQTTTDPHEFNHNLVRSDFTEALQITTPGQAPAIADLGSFVYSVPAAANLVGDLGTMWRTEIVLHNPGPDVATVSLAFLERDEDNRDAVPAVMLVEAGQSYRIDDVLTKVFGLDEKGGGLLVGSDHELIVTSRTYNDDTDGTYGQYVPGEPYARVATIREPAYLMQLTNDEAYRSNLGVLNSGAAPIEISIDVFSENRVLFKQTLQLPSYGSLQINRLFGNQEVDNGSAMVSCATPGAAFFAYASVIDNTSGDPVYISPAKVAEDGILHIPAVANIPGSSNTLWRSDLQIFNPGNERAQVRLELLHRNRDNSDPLSVVWVLEAGESQRFENVMQSLFETADAGALRITADTGQVMATSRTYTNSETGTFGQFIPGVTIQQAVAGTDAAKLVHLAHSAADSSGFRTNIGLVNASALSFEVEITLSTGSGSTLGVVSVQLSPFDVQQLNDVFSDVNAPDLSDAVAVVRADNPLARFFAYASVVDNKSGDPIYIPAAVDIN